MKLTDVTVKNDVKVTGSAPPPQDDFGVFDDATKKAAKAKKVAANAQQAGYTQVTADLHEKYDGKRCAIDDVEDIANQTIAALPRLDADAIRAEIDNMTVDVQEEPTTTQLAAAMAEVQAYKDRICAIANQVEREYMIRKRTLDMLFDANQAVSSASSADKRKGEAQLRWPMLQMDLVNVEVLRLEVNNVVNTLRAKGDMLSRQASILQMQVQLGEYRRTVPQGYSDVKAEEMSWADV